MATNARNGSADGATGADAEASDSHPPQTPDAVAQAMPQTTIYVEPIAFPAVLGLAGFAGSTWIGSMFLAQWWGSVDSTPVWGVFTALWGGLGQFIAGFFGYHSRDTVITAVHVLWGSFWISLGLLGAFEVRSQGNSGVRTMRC